jgi:glycyl-tRNA synthetase beta chain
MSDFLLEIGLEEIPARMIDGAEQELQRRLADLLTRESLAESPQIELYSTPRRLAMLAREVRDAQADAEEQMKGPSVQVAYKDGQPTVAAIKFAERAGVDVAKLERLKDAKGEYISAHVTRKGRTAEQILSEALPKEINALYWAKNMYWRAGKPERFVRPVRWLVAMLGGKVVPLEFAGVKAGKTSRGHRLQLPVASRQLSVEIQEPQAYAAVLKDAGVIVRREERVELIRKELDKATRQIPGARWREDASLLQTVVDLTEFPGVILGNFDPEFLALPEEVLVTVMRDHQKYFAVEDASGKLAPHFLAVLNTGSDPQGIIRHGHERVLRARFNDARFFWDTDQKHPLRERVEWLKNVTFQKDLGSYYDKTMRVQRLASQICAALNDEDNTLGLANTGLDRGTQKLVRDGVVHKAALLAKTDLTTELVKEFTELQGIVGGLYAKVQGLDAAIGDAIYDQYKPVSMEDAVPRTIEGAVLSIADKADSIAGMFALGLIPSGSKDPFALRRQANGIVKTIAEHKLTLAIDMIFIDARAGYRGSEAEKKFVEDKSTDTSDFYCRLSDFFRERLEFYMREALGFAYDVTNAVLAAGFGDFVDAVSRAQSLAGVRGSEDFESIGIAFKRIKNILRQARESGKSIAAAFDPAKVTDEAERGLAEAMNKTAPRVRELAAKRDYSAALAEIATIRPAVDTFFDKVMVMVEDEGVRANRLALLQSLLNEFSTIADFSEIVTEKNSNR